ncbi:MAG: hypothetical protein HQL06_10965 [Nitrospirae bacterium]|nr:hypothetical protein [Nitrospirota bacterium]
MDIMDKNISDITVRELVAILIDLIETKIDRRFELICGDPDAGLEIKEELRAELLSCLQDRSDRVPHEEVIKELEKLDLVEEGHLAVEKY